MERLSARLLIWGIVGFLAQFIDATLGTGYGVFSATLLIAGGLYPAIVSAVCILLRPSQPLSLAVPVFGLIT